MSRKSPSSITLRPNLRCLQVYPVAGTKRTIEELQTVGMRLSKEQAVNLARVLLAASQDWTEMEVTAYRGKARTSDGTFHVTVTTAAG